MTFVDSSAWFAAYVPSDRHHQAVSSYLRLGKTIFVTSDYIVDETITLLQRRGEKQRAVQFGKDIFVMGIVRLELLALADLIQAYQVFARYGDKKWSFTDCTSYVLMRRLGLSEVVTLDHHFDQMPGIGSVHLLS